MGSARPWVAAPALALVGLLLAGSAGAETVFLSTQLRPIEEAQKVREVILKDFKGPVQFVPEDTGPFLTRVKAEAQTKKVAVSLLGALHSDLPPLVEIGALDPVDDVVGKLGDRKLVPSLVELGKMGTGHQVYVPWMQATYIMAASKKALPHLPKGANLQRLSYAELGQWAKSVQEATGERRLGFPAGPKGLMHRFFQGYLYPSYTGGVVRPFKSADAVTMWTEFRDLWAHVNPRSTAYDFMQEPLLAGEVWIAFDHVARLADALRQKPDEFVTFPAPAGPKGRGFMPVVAGLAIPKGAPDRAGAAALIEYLTRPAVQVVTAREVGFYPVSQVELPADLPAGVKLAAAAIQAQAGAPDAKPSLLPLGLGAKNGEFNKIFLDTFQQVVLRKEDPRRVLDQQGKRLGEILTESGAPCWAPDAPSQGACPVQ
jgi:multiple sugar transport system substrate-binding protein